MSPESNLFSWGSFLEFWAGLSQGCNCRARRSRCGGEGEEGVRRRALWPREQLLDRSSEGLRKTLASCVLIGIVMGKKSIPSSCNL